MEDEYVRQVLEEEQQHYGNDYDHYDDDQQQQQQQQQQQDYVDEEERRRAMEEQAAREAADRIAAERERKFQADLDRMKDEDQRKLALKQKKLDGKIVKTVLKAAEKQDLYKVLGLRSWKLETPPKTIEIPGTPIRFTIPPITLVKGATEQQIKKGFRKRAKQVHPDKNRDGRAREAFVAVEHAASVLSDRGRKEIYDRERKQRSSEQLDRSKRVVIKAVSAVWAFTLTALKMVHTLLGPFFVPVIIILALII